MKQVKYNPFKCKPDPTDIIFNPSEEAKICLNCDLQDCTNKRNCARFNEEKEKLKNVSP